MKYLILTKLNKQIFATSIAFMFAVCFTSCDKDGSSDFLDREYDLIWSDEFVGQYGDLPDSSKWTYDLGTGNDGWGNSELQTYRDLPDNVSLDGLGNLVITAMDEAFGGSPFTSGRVKTQGLFTAKYGRVEANIKIPFGPGIWPAFWMLGSNIDEVSWPQCGEIDILEARGQAPSIMYGSLHGPGYSAGTAVTEAYNLGNDRFDSDFHIYAIEWGEDYIDFFVDDILYNQVTAEDVAGEWVYNNSFFMVLNVAVGGGFAGFPTTGTPFPQRMLVDYVRVYKEI